MQSVLKVPYELKSVSCYSDLENNVFVPSIQRNLNEARAREIAEYIYNSADAGVMPILGVIDLCHFCGRYYVIDGQHRLKALEIAYKEKRKIIAFPVIIYPVNSTEEMAYIFRVRNMGEPVPDFIKEAETDSIEFLKDCEKWLLSQNYEICKPDCKNRPLLSVNRFMDAFTKSRAFTVIKTLESFAEHVSRLNQKIAYHYNDERNRKKAKVSDAMWEKASKNGIYLGLCFSETYAEYIDSVLVAD